MKKAKKIAQLIIAAWMFLSITSTTVTARDSFIMGTASVYRTSDIAAFIDGRSLSFDQPPIIINNRVMVPFRAIFETLGSTVSWDPRTRQIYAFNDTHQIVLTVGSERAIVNGTHVTLDTPPFIAPETNRTLVPLRFVAESFGAEVTWDAQTRSIHITTQYASTDPSQDRTKKTAQPAVNVSVREYKLRGFGGLPPRSSIEITSLSLAHRWQASDPSSMRRFFGFSIKEVLRRAPMPILSLE